MIRLALPLVLVIAAIGLFVVWTNPHYQGTKALQAQVSSYDDALNKSQELRGARDQLLKKRNTFEASSVQKLQSVLPDNVDNIRLVIDINNVAARHNLTLKDVSLGSVSDSRTARNALAAGSSGDAVGSVDIGFSVSSNYDNMLAFLQDLEHSLRLIDVEKLGFSSGSSDLSSYAFTIRTYWLH